MNPDDFQQNDVNMTPEEAKASLGLATRLSEQMLMAQAQQMGVEAPQDAQNGTGQERGEETKKEPSVDTEALKSEIVAEVKEGIKDIVKEEMSTLRKEIQDALEDEEE